VGRNTITETSTHGLSFGKVNCLTVLQAEENLTKLKVFKVLSLKETVGVATVQLKAQAEDAFRRLKRI
jgi:hypothetical protein